MTEKMAFSPRELVELLGISRTAIYEAIASGRIEHVRWGRRILVPRAAVEALLRTDSVSHESEA